MKMEGLWYTHFSTGQAQADGMAVLRNGEILGGDPAHTYCGSYTTDGPNLYMNVRVSPYTGHGASDMTRPMTFVLWGSANEVSANVSGCAESKRDLKAIVDFHRAS